MSKNNPFFSNFMEAQTLTEEEAKQAAGGVTLIDASELPDDLYDRLKKPINVTMKAPSDGDEGTELELL